MLKKEISLHFLFPYTPFLQVYCQQQPTYELSVRKIRKIHNFTIDCHSLCWELYVIIYLISGVVLLVLIHINSPL